MRTTSELRAAAGDRQPGDCAHHELPIGAIDAYPSLAALLAEWRRDCAGLTPPRRVDPLTMPRRLLPYALLMDLDRGAGRLRVRLAGTMLCELHRRELKGRGIDEIFPAMDAAAMVRSALVAAARARPMLIRRVDMLWLEARLDYVALLLPLSDATGCVDRLLEMPDPASFRRRSGPAS